MPCEIDTRRWSESTAQQVTANIKFCKLKEHGLEGKHLTLGINCKCNPSAKDIISHCCWNQGDLIHDKWIPRGAWRVVYGVGISVNIHLGKQCPDECVDGIMDWMSKYCSNRKVIKDQWMLTMCTQNVPNSSDFIVFLPDRHGSGRLVTAHTALWLCLKWWRSVRWCLQYSAEHMLLK